MYAYDMCECCLSIDYIGISSTVDSIGYVAILDWILMTSHIRTIPVYVS